MVALAGGAALGAALRYGTAVWATARYAPAFPLGTFLVNSGGSLLLGFFLSLVAARSEIGPAWRLFVATGFCGSLTTFSTFSYETFKLLEQGAALPALFYALSSLVVGVVCVYAGSILARALF